MRPVWLKRMGWPPGVLNFVLNRLRAAGAGGGAAALYGRDGGAPDAAARTRALIIACRSAGLHERGVGPLELPVLVLLRVEEDDAEGTATDVMLEALGSLSALCRRPKPRAESCAVGISSASEISTESSFGLRLLRCITLFLHWGRAESRSS